MSKKEMIKRLLDAFDYAVTAGSPDECARQFVIWQNRVASALMSAGMAEEHKAWLQAMESTDFYADDPSFPAQAESMKAILLGILDRLDQAEYFVDQERLNEIRALKSNHFDLSKLIRLCEEINICYERECYFSVAALVRTILNHVPPIFGFQSFPQVCASYGGSTSFKKAATHLEESSRKIADSLLHMPIGKQVDLPNKSQVNFSSDLDFLLQEIVKLLKVDAS